MHRLTVLVSAALLLIASTSSGDVRITNRTSHLATSIDFGHVGNVNNSIDSLVYTNIDDTQLMRQGGATDGGPIGDVSWDATYQFNLDQQLIPGNSQGFSGSGGIGLFTFVGGEGVSYLWATNQLEIDFENTTPTAFELAFIGTDTSHIELQEMTSLGDWESVYSHPGGFGEIAAELPLGVGEYRLKVGAVANTDNGGSNGGSYSFSIAAVPEPSSMVLLSISAALLLLRCR